MTNKIIEQFIKNIFQKDHSHGEMISELKELALFINPKATLNIKYGGLCFFIDNELCTGFFVYTKHLSVEFGQGFEFTNKYKQLEGKGKYRRHIKLLNLDDIEKKHVEYYLKQALG